MNTRDVNRGRNTSSTDSYIRHIWIQKVYATKLGYFEVAPSDPNSTLEHSQINDDHATSTNEHDDSPSDRDVDLDIALPREQKEAFFQAQLINTTPDPQVRLSKTSYAHAIDFHVLCNLGEQWRPPLCHSCTASICSVDKSCQYNIFTSSQL